MAATDLPDATVARLPLYLRALIDQGAAGQATVSSDRLAELAGFNAAMVRKDLSHLGSYGTRGVGYDVDHLLGLIRVELGLHRRRSVVIAGAGHLGQALCNYSGFSDRGFPIRALVDVDPDKVGTTVNGIPVCSPAELATVISGDPFVIGVIATPANVAQAVVDHMADLGVHSFLVFAPSAVNVPDGVTVRRVDLALELQILSFYAERGGQPVDAAAAGGSRVAPGGRASPGSSAPT